MLKMWRNYFKASFRYLIRKPIYTSLNVLGLALGFLVVAVTLSWTYDEITYDQFHDDADRIFRVVGKVSTDSEQFNQAVTPPPLAEALVREIPGIETSIRLAGRDALVEHKGQKYAEDEILLADGNFFSFFDFNLIKGDSSSVLSQPYSLVLTTSASKKYFGKENPIGESLKLYLFDREGNGADYKVTGIAAEAPQNSHIKYGMIVSSSTFESTLDAETLNSPDYWFWNSLYTYFKISEPSQINEVEESFPLLIDKYMGRRSSEFKMYYEYTAQSIGDIHLFSDLRYDASTNGSLESVIIISSIGLFVLVLALINYINLSTAYQLSRSKETGMRRVMGAVKSQVIFHHMLEALIIACIAGFIALFLIEMVRPLFRELSGQHLPNLTEVNFLGSFALLVVTAGILGGLFPGWYGLKVRPLSLVKQNSKQGGSSEWLRKGLIVFQFCIGFVLIAGIFIINMQMDHITNQSLGYDKDQVLAVKVNGDEKIIRQFPVLKNELLQATEIKGVTTARSNIIDGLGNSLAKTLNNKGELVNSSIYRLQVGFDYLRVMGVELLAGRSFSEDFPTDREEAFILNESAIQLFGWAEPELAIGSFFEMFGRKGKVIGVIRDFHFNTLHHPIAPVAISLHDENFSQIMIAFHKGAGKGAASILERTWSKVIPGAMLDYGYNSNYILKAYESEKRFGQLFIIFCILSVTIACLGIFGLSTFIIQQKTREIGIRKILGASARQLVALLTGGFSRLLVLSFVASVPLTIWIMQQWLDNFAYRIELSWLTFALSGAILFCIALLVVVIQTIRASLVNPVDYLRQE